MKGADADTQDAYSSIFSWHYNFLMKKKVLEHSRWEKYSFGCVCLVDFSLRYSNAMNGIY